MMNDKLLEFAEGSAIRADKVTNYACMTGSFGTIELHFYFGTEWSHYVICDNMKEATKIINEYKKLIGVYDDEPEPEQDTSELFTEVIAFAIDDDEPKEFLRCWSEGDWESIKKEWPEFKGYVG